MPDECELLLVFAGRSTHLANVIRPALERGAWVVCDRFTDATYAYQGGGRGMDVAQIATLEQWVQKDLRPDLTLLLDAPLELTASRAQHRNTTTGTTDRFECEQREFFERVRSTYRARAEREPNRIVVIDASVARDQVSAAIRAAIEERLF